MVFVYGFKYRIAGPLRSLRVVLREGHVPLAASITQLGVPPELEATGIAPRLLPGEVAFTAVSRDGRPVFVYVNKEDAEYNLQHVRDERKRA